MLHSLFANCDGKNRVAVMSQLPIPLLSLSSTIRHHLALEIWTVISPNFQDAWILIHGAEVGLEPRTRQASGEDSNLLGSCRMTRAEAGAANARSQGGGH